MARTQELKPYVIFTGDLPDPGIEPGSPALQADALPAEPPGKLLSLTFILNSYC